MVTGDAEGTAATVAREVGINVSSRFGGAEVAALGDEELAAHLAAGSVLFSRTTPEDKLRIVRILRARGEIVGMTGDGVNDAPALKQADIGIAMGIRGTDVARGAADLVVTDDNFASIVAAVHEGRRQFDNIRQFIGYLLSSNTGEVLALLLNVMTGGPLILLPVQILWMNLLTDGVTALALGAEPAEPNVMRRPPRSPSAAILQRPDLLGVLRNGAYIGLATFAAFRLWLGNPATAPRAQTMAFAVIILAEIFNVLNYRASRMLDRAGWRANPLMVAALAGSLLLHLASIGWEPLRLLLGTVPLSGTDWSWAVALAAPVILLPRSRAVADQPHPPDAE
jgi:Ca2+-transporting ATPase